jgi:hypothetical protein
LVLREVVTERVVADEGWLRRWGELQGVAADDQVAFVATARRLIETMHEGVIGRYRITREEYERWSSDSE